MTTNSTAGPTALGSSALGASALYGALGALWAYGAAIAVASGWQPTPFRSPQAWPYPTQAVLGVIVLVSAEVALLYAILRPKSYAASWRRLAGAIGACFGLLVWEAVPVAFNRPGYAYVNADFLATAIFLFGGLLAIHGLWSLASRVRRIARRHAA